jgi:hypothetical protein
MGDEQDRLARLLPNAKQLYLHEVARLGDAAFEGISGSNALRTSLPVGRERTAHRADAAKSGFQVAYWAQVAALGRTIREIRRGLRAIPDALKVPLSLSRRWQLARAASNCGAIATLSFKQRHIAAAATLSRPQEHPAHRQVQ